MMPDESHFGSDGADLLRGDSVFAGVKRPRRDSGRRGSQNETTRFWHHEANQLLRSQNETHPASSLSSLHHPSVHYRPTL